MIIDSTGGVMSSGIYKIINKINGKVYVGQTNNFRKRWRNHKWKLNNNKHFNQHLQNSWNKYGERNFSFSVIEIIFDKNRKTLKEKKWISLYKSFNRDFGYNIIKDPENPSLSEETKRKISCENNGRSILKKEDVKKIIDLIIENKKTYKQIGDKFNVSENLVKKIKLGKRWNRFDYYIEKKCEINMLNRLRKIDDKKILRIKELRKIGKSFAKIGEELDISKSSAQRLFKECLRNGG